MKELINKIKDLEKQQKHIETLLEESRANMLKKFIDKKLYCPLYTLKNYVEWDINAINLVLETGEVLNVKYKYQDYRELDFIYISDKGELGISTQDYYVQNNIVYKQDTKIEIGKIVGYYDLILRENYSQKSVRQTKFNYLVNQYLKGNKNDL